MKKRWLITPIVLLLLAFIVPLASAEGFNISIKPVKDRVTHADWAIFDLTLLNNEDIYMDTFTLSSKSEGTEWSLLTESTVDYTTGIAVNPHVPKTIRLLLKDKGLAESTTKAYLVDLSVQSSRTGLEETRYLQIFVVPPETLVYEPNLTVTLNFPRFIDPKNIYSLLVHIKNNNPAEIKNLGVKLESALINRESTVVVEPNIEESVEFTVGFDENQKPLLDTLTVIVTEGNNIIYRQTMPIEVVGYRLAFKQEASLEKKFLRYKETIRVTNQDFVTEQQQVTVQTDWFRKYFTTTDPASDCIVKDGQKYLKWDVKLSPGESTTLVLIKEYRLLFLSLVVLAFAVVAYIVLRSPVHLRKDAEIVSTSQGGISEVKVVIELKNRTNKMLKKVTLVDRIPHMIDIDKKAEFGTLAPKKMMRTNKGTILTWEMELEPKEERIIKYLIRSKLSILGEVILPPASIYIHDETGVGKKRVRSNEAHVKSE